MLASRQVARRTAISSSTTRHAGASSGRFLITIKQYLSSSSGSSQLSNDETLDSGAGPAEEIKPEAKTQAELDKELLVKLQGLDGDGGAAGVEYEDGKPVSMKRSVKNNMFRYI